MCGSGESAPSACTGWGGDGQVRRSFSREFSRRPPSQFFSPFPPRHDLSVCQPDPIMRLEHIVGLSGQLPGAVQWSGDGSEVLFPSGNVVIAMGADPRPTEDVDGSTTGERNSTTKWRRY